tara:strand:- start:2571 stop:2906 length:336 start_codon:yes stop_codon:yes gene_type:complete
MASVPVLQQDQDLISVDTDVGVEDSSVMTKALDGNFNQRIEEPPSNDNYYYFIKTPGMTFPIVDNVGILCASDLGSRKNNNIFSSITLTNKKLLIFTRERGGLTTDRDTVS